MKTIIFFFILSSSLLAHEVQWQDKLIVNQALDRESNSNHGLKKKVFAKSIFVKYSKEISRLRKVLGEDKTDTITYELAKFSCHNFAKKVYLQNSSLVKDLTKYNIEDLEKEWGVKVNRDPKKEKVPMNYITLSSKKDGYFHAINAVLLDTENPQEIKSYVFIEPQSDALYSSDQLKSFSERLMKKGFKGSIEVGVGTFDSFTYNGNIWQSFSSYQHKFEIN